MKMPTVLIMIVLLPLTTVAHPGKTDRQGGHKCYKECAEWNLYYAEYHLHDKDGKPVKVARKKLDRSRTAAAQAEEKAAIEKKPAERAVDTTPFPPVAAAAAIADEPAIPLLPWILLMLFLLLFFVVRRNRRKASGAD